LVEIARGRTRLGDPQTTTGRRFLIGYCFSTFLKTEADHLFGTRPSEDWGDRARCSTKKGSGTIGTKTILGEM